MAVKSKIKIDAESEEFRRFYAQFQAFQSELAKLPPMWATLAAATKKEEAAQESLTGAITRHIDVAGSAQAVTARFEQLSTRTEASWSNLSQHTKSVASSVATMTVALFSWTMIASLVGGLLGAAGGLFGLANMSSSVSNQRRSAMAMGSSIGESRAFPINFGRFIDTDLLFRGVSRGYYDQTGPEYTAMTLAGVQGVGQGGVAANALQLLHRLPGLFPKGISREQIGPRLTQLGLDRFFTPEGVSAYTQNVSPEERAEQDRHYADDIRTLEMTDATGQAWQNFIMQLDNAKAEIEISLAEGLSGLVKPLTDLSKAFSDVVLTVTSDRANDIGKWATDAGVGLEFLAKKIGDPEFTKEIVGFLDQTAGWIGTLRRVGSALGRFGQILDFAMKYGVFGALGGPSEEQAPAMGHVYSGPQRGPIYRRLARPDLTRTPRTVAPVTTPSILTGPTMATPAADQSGMSRDYGNLHLGGVSPVGGGPATPGLIMLAHHLQDTDPDVDVFTAFSDRYHVFANPSSFHNRGLAFDVTEKDRNYEAARDRVREYLTKLGFTEGDMSGRTGDFAIEPGTTDHMHVQFNSVEAAQRYAAMMKAANDAAGAPTAEAPAKQSALFGTPDFAFGDSTLVNFHLPGSAVVGRSPFETKNAMYDFLNSAEGANIKGKKFLLSSNSNDPSETGLDWVEFMAKTLQMRGGIVDIMGGGPRPDIAAWNKPLADFASEHGMGFTPMGATGADQVHERSPADQLESVKSTPIPSTPANLHSSMLDHYMGLYDSRLLDVHDATHGSAVVEWA